jgi:uncharacterized protein
MNCPRCKLILKTKAIKEFKITIEADQCPECEGMWFDKGELSRLDKIVEPTLIEIRKIPSRQQQMQELKCPKCDQRPMLKADHPRDRKVIMDYCPTCQGIWLDKGELDAIQKENWFVTIGAVFAWMVGAE